MHGIDRFCGTTSVLGSSRARPGNKVPPFRWAAGADWRRISFLDGSGHTPLGSKFGIRFSSTQSARVLEFFPEDAYCIDVLFARLVPVPRPRGGQALAKKLSQNSSCPFSLPARAGASASELRRCGAPHSRRYSTSRFSWPIRPGAKLEVEFCLLPTISSQSDPRRQRRKSSSRRKRLRDFFRFGESSEGSEVVGKASRFHKLALEFSGLGWSFRGLRGNHPPLAFGRSGSLPGDNFPTTRKGARARR